MNPQLFGTFPPGSFCDRSFVSLADRDGLRENDVNWVVVPPLLQFQAFPIPLPLSRAESTYEDLGVWANLAATH